MCDSNYPPHRLGRRGERVAEGHLVAHGWRVLARNYRFGRREIDLVIERNGLLAFVEVKTRATAGFGGPAAAVDWRKRREIEAVAAHYLAERGGGASGVRFDVVAVLDGPGREGPRIEHFEDAWRPGS